MITSIKFPYQAAGMFLIAALLITFPSCEKNDKEKKAGLFVGHFNGENAKAVVLPEFNPIMNSFSWNFWFKTDARPHLQVIATSGHHSLEKPESGWSFYKQNNSIYLRLVSENDSSVTTRAVARDRMWHMISSSIDREKKVLSMFVDGEKVDEKSIEQLNSIDSGDSLAVGSLLGGAAPFLGSIADFDIYPNALNKEKIEKLYSDVPEMDGVLLNLEEIDELKNDFELATIDLSEDSERQFVVDREESIYFGHPTTVKIDDNGTESILAVYPKGAHARGITTLRKSTDGGRTWEEPNASATSLGKIQEVPTIHKLSDQNGVERLIIFTGLYPTRISFSEDNGKTWSGYQPVGDWGGIVTMGDLIPLKNLPEDAEFVQGKYMAFFHDDGRFFAANGKRRSDPRSVRLYKTLTTDGGLTWSFPELIWENTEKFICEPGLVRSPDGKQLAMLLRENFRKHNAQVIFSNDEGITWTEPRDLPRSLTGDRHVLRYAPDGRIVCVFRDRQKNSAPSSTEGDYIAWVGTYEDIVSTSPGQYRVRLLNNYKGWDCGYSGLELLEDGTFLATTYLTYKPEDYPNNSVISVKFGLGELDEIYKSN